MTQALRTYLVSLAAVSLLTSLCMSLLPKGSVRSILSLCCALLIALTAVRPLLSVDDVKLSQALARLRMEAEQTRTGVEVKNRQLVSDIIKQQTQSYILDKAASLGMELTVEVKVAGDLTYPYPSEVILSGFATQLQREQLSIYITEQLAIPAERQIWQSG